MKKHASFTVCFATLCFCTGLFADGPVPRSEYQQTEDGKRVPRRVESESAKEVDSAEAAKNAQAAQVQRRNSRTEARARSLAAAAERRASAKQAREARAERFEAELAKQEQDREKAWQALENFAEDTYPALKELVADMRKRSEEAAVKAAADAKERHEKRVAKFREAFAKQMESGDDSWGDLFKLPGTGEKKDGAAEGGDAEGEGSAEAAAGAAAAKLMLMFFGF